MSHIGPSSETPWRPSHTKKLFVPHLIFVGSGPLTVHYASPRPGQYSATGTDDNKTLYASISVAVWLVDCTCNTVISYHNLKKNAALWNKNLQVFINMKRLLYMHCAKGSP